MHITSREMLASGVGVLVALPLAGDRDTLAVRSDWKDFGVIYEARRVKPAHAGLNASEERKLTQSIFRKVAERKLLPVPVVTKQPRSEERRGSRRSLARDA